MSDTQVHRTRRTLTERHNEGRHAVKGYTCPLCNPSGWRPEDVG